MKKCPICKMTVNDESECHICGATLTYEEALHGVSETRLLNKYYVAYIAKNTWFSILCALICIAKLLISPPSAKGAIAAAVLFLMISLASSVFSRKLKESQVKYSERYFEAILFSQKYVCGAMAILFCFVG